MRVEALLSLPSLRGAGTTVNARLDINALMATALHPARPRSAQDALQALLITAHARTVTLAVKTESRQLAPAANSYALIKIAPVATSAVLVMPVKTANVKSRYAAAHLYAHRPWSVVEAFAKCLIDAMKTGHVIGMETAQAGKSAKALTLAVRAPFNTTAQT